MEIDVAYGLLDAADLEAMGKSQSSKEKDVRAYIDALYVALEALDHLSKLSDLVELVTSNYQARV